MNNTNSIETFDRLDPEPRWPAWIAVLAVGGLHTALPSYLLLGPRWVFPTIVVALLVPTVISHAKKYHQLNRVVGFAVSGSVTLALIVSVILLISELPTHHETPIELLLSAGSLWFTNILVFALWYWRLGRRWPTRTRSAAPVILKVRSCSLK